MTTPESHELSSRVPTLREALQHSQELEYWNNYVAQKLGANMRELHAVLDVVGKFNDTYQKDWLDRPVTQYVDAMVKYCNLLGINNGESDGIVK